MIDCPYYKPPRLLVDSKTGKDYEGAAMCDLVDKYCLLEYSCGNTECETYNDYLKEAEDE